MLYIALYIYIYTYPSKISLVLPSNPLAIERNGSTASFSSEMLTQNSERQRCNSSDVRSRSRWGWGLWETEISCSMVFWNPRTCVNKWTRRTCHHLVMGWETARCDLFWPIQVSPWSILLHTSGVWTNPLYFRWEFLHPEMLSIIIHVTLFPLFWVSSRGPSRAYPVSA